MTDRGRLANQVAVERRVQDRRELAPSSRGGAIRERSFFVGGRPRSHPSSNLREVVRDALGSVDRVGAVDPGPALLTSNPPKFRVNYVVALTSGWLVRDEVVVVVPLEVRVLPVADEAMGRQARRCGSAVPGS
jgi:hypothetical protein